MFQSLVHKYSNWIPLPDIMGAAFHTSGYQSLQGVCFHKVFRKETLLGYNPFCLSFYVNRLITAPEEFINMEGDWSTYQIFSSTLRRVIYKRNNHRFYILSLCLRKLGHENHVTIGTSSFQKSFVFQMFPATTRKRNAGFFTNSSGLRVSKSSIFLSELGRPVTVESILETLRYVTARL